MFFEELNLRDLNSNKINLISILQLSHKRTIKTKSHTIVNKASTKKNEMHKFISGLILRLDIDCLICFL